MKQKTILIIGAIGLAGVGLYLYRKKKQDDSVSTAVAPAQVVETNTAQIKLPVASDQVVINLPQTLLQPSGNTGIVPPSVSVQPSAPVLAPAPSPSVVQSQPKTGIALATQTMLKRSGLALKGLGDAYILN